MISDKENQIIELIYDAGLKPDLWEKVLEEITKFTHSSTAIYTYMDQLNPSNNFVFSHNIPREGLENYQKENLDVIDMRLHGERMKQIGVGRSYSIDSRPYATTQDTDAQKFYELCLKPSNICYLNGVLLEHGPYKWAMFAIHRPQDTRKYTPTDAKIIERFAKHIRRSLQIYRQISESRQENENYLQLIEKIKVGVVFLNEKNELQYSNQFAQKILNQTTSIWIDQRNHFKTIQNYQAELEKIIWVTLNQALNEGQSEEKGGVICIPQTNAEPAIMLTVVPLGRVIQSEIIKSHKMVAIFISQVNAEKSLSSKILKDMYMLSPREIQICELFLNGLKLEEISLKCQITMNSMRTYMKTIFSKMNCCSQADLMRLLLNLTINFEHIE